MLPNTAFILSLILASATAHVLVDVDVPSVNSLPVDSSSAHPQLQKRLADCGPGLYPVGATIVNGVRTVMCRSWALDGPMLVNIVGVTLDQLHHVLDRAVQQWNTWWGAEIQGDQRGGVHTPIGRLAPSCPHGLVFDRPSFNCRVPTMDELLASEVKSEALKRDVAASTGIDGHASLYVPSNDTGIFLAYSEQQETAVSNSTRIRKRDGKDYWYFW